jgi:hypothetical protein
MVRASTVVVAALLLVGCTTSTKTESVAPNPGDDLKVMEWLRSDEAGARLAVLRSTDAKPQQGVPFTGADLVREHPGKSADEILRAAVPDAVRNRPGEGGFAVAQFLQMVLSPKQVQTIFQKCGIGSNNNPGPWGCPRQLLLVFRDEADTKARPAEWNAFTRSFSRALQLFASDTPVAQSLPTERIRSIDAKNWRGLKGEALVWWPIAGPRSAGYSATFGLAWSGDSRSVAITAGPVIHVIDVMSGTRETFAGSEDGNWTAVALSPSGDFVAAGRNNAVHVWDRFTGTEVFATTEAADSTEVRTLAWSPDGKHLVGNAGGATQQWTTADWKFVRRLPYSWGFAWSPDSSQIALLGVDGKRSSISDAQTGVLGATIDVPFERAVWVDDDTLVLTTGERFFDSKNKPHKWSLKTSKLEPYVNGMFEALNPDGTVGVAYRKDIEIVLGKLSKGKSSQKTLFKIPYADPISSASEWSPDGRLLANADGAVLTIFAPAD